jgi:S-DNA-T family DNA segregation ATPase FtsK/SpoIIIE
MLTNKIKIKMAKRTPRKQRYLLAEPSQKNLSQWISELNEKFDGSTFDISGVVIFSFALMSLLALMGLTGGSLLTPWANTLWRWFGYGAVFVMGGIGVSGLLIIRKPKEGRNEIDWWKFVKFEVLLLLLLMFLTQTGGISIERAESGLDGGYTGWALAGILALIIPNLFLQGLITFLFLVFFFFLTFDLFPVVEQFLSSISNPDGARSKNESSTFPEPAENPFEVGNSKTKDQPRRSTHTTLPIEFRKNLKATQDNDLTSTMVYERNEQLPPLTLLSNEQNTAIDEKHINTTAGLIEKTLADFGVPAKVIGYRTGPIVTQYAVQPGYIKKPGSTETDEQAMKVRVSQIANLQSDLALATSAFRLRIEAPVPGRAYIGIEVPNSQLTAVRLRPILESEPYNKLKTPLAFALGRDVSGHPLVADLAKMPHLLVAGQTGSGKSVFIAALAACLAMNNHPDEMRLVMIDVKMVELIRFNGLPHLLGKVETDVQRILGVLRWLVNEMEHRYRLLEGNRSRDLNAYNKKTKNRLPRIVVIIDELADLMMSSPEQVEVNLVRLAQKARATGIHLVVATQRPSTDVVTGTIKANFPARLAFAVASGIDSRVILDSTGAESLLGKGDLLFLDPAVGNPVRAQGVWITDNEIEKIIAHWQKEIQNKNDAPPWESLLYEPQEDSNDALIDQAIEIVRSSQKASASLIQRKLKIGYPRAARLIDQLEEMGVVGPSMGGGKDRDVLVDPIGNDEEIE